MPGTHSQTRPNRPIRAIRPLTLAAAAILLTGAIPHTSPLTAAAAAQPDDPAVARAKRDNLAKLLRPITLDVEDQRLEDVFTFITDFTGADLEVRYLDDTTPDGLDPDALITITARNMSTLQLVELVAEQAARDGFEEATWQLTPWGSVEVGLKSQLNRRQRVQLYDISDLLLVLPDYADAPQIDLQSVLQSGQGGGGGQSPFDGDGDEADEERDLQQRREDVIDLIQTIVEPDQWQATGGDGGSIRIYQNALVVRAADYMHRQIDGYRFWPSRSQSATFASGRRYVGFTLDTGISTVDGFENAPVVVPGGG